MEQINIISLGSFKIDNRELFENLLEVKGIEKQEIKNIEDGEKVNYIDKERGVLYKDYHFVTDGLAFKNIAKNLRILLNDVKNGENHLVIYIINNLDKKIFNESLEIINELSQNKKVSFLLIYIEGYNNENLEYIDELNQIMNIKVLKIKGNSFKFSIDEQVRKDFFSILREGYYNSEKRLIEEKFATKCMKMVYSSNLKLSNESLTEKDIFKMKNTFAFDLNKEIKVNVKNLNSKIESLSECFKLEPLKSMNIIEKKIEEKYDESILGSMAKEANKEEPISLTQAIFNKFKKAKKKEIIVEKDYGKIFVNEAFSEKKRMEKIFSKYEFDNKMI